MKSLFELLAEVAVDLEEYPWALIGGLAVGVRTEPRFTRDIDLAVEVEDDEQAEKLIFALRARKYRIAAVLEQSSGGRLATVRLLPPGDDRLVDLLFCSTGIEKKIVRSAQMFEISPILARDDTRRPQDRLDLKALFQSCDASDLNTAREALQEITTAGLSRGRGLLAELEVALTEFGHGEKS